MRCRNIEEARAQAKANAKQTGQRWTVFTDTSGNARAERFDNPDAPSDGTSAVGDYEVFDPPKAKAKYRFKSREAAEAAEQRAKEESWMLQTALEAVLSGWIGTERGGDPVKFSGHWHTVVAMSPDSASGGFVMLIRHKHSMSKGRPRKSVEVFSAKHAKEWRDSLVRMFSSDAPDAKERQELLDLLAKAINALPYA